jgi:ribosomal protein L29
VIKDKTTEELLAMLQEANDEIAGRRKPEQEVSPLFAYLREMPDAELSNYYDAAQAELTELQRAQVRASSKPPTPPPAPLPVEEPHPVTVDPKPEATESVPAPAPRPGKPHTNYAVDECGCAACRIHRARDRDIQVTHDIVVKSANDPMTRQEWHQHYTLNRKEGQ